jgi:hypothetical protein
MFRFYALFLRMETDGEGIVVYGVSFCFLLQLLRTLYEVVR